MFDVGFTELVVLFVIGLLILGPERLPRVASQIGRWVGRARRTAHQLRLQLEREMALNEIKRPRDPPPPPKPENTKTDQTTEEGPEGDETPRSDDAGSSADEATESDPATGAENGETEQRRPEDQ